MCMIAVILGARIKGAHVYVLWKHSCENYSCDEFLFIANFVGHEYIVIQVFTMIHIIITILTH